MTRISFCPNLFLSMLDLSSLELSLNVEVLGEEGLPSDIIGENIHTISDITWEIFKYQKCLKGHKSLRSLFDVKSKSPGVSESVSQSVSQSVSE